MLSRACSAAVNGIDAYVIEVEVNCGYGDTLIVVLGLPDAAVKESKDRVSTALSNSGYKFPMGKTTINLAPADIRKEGPSFDLPIAIAMLAASEQLETDQLDNFVIIGELALTGGVRPVNGVLPIALRAQSIAAGLCLKRGHSEPLPRILFHFLVGFTWIYPDLPGLAQAKDEGSPGIPPSPASERALRFGVTDRNWP